MQDNLSELPGVIDLAARIGVEEVYLQRMVYGFSSDALARAGESILAERYRQQADALIAVCERRAAAQGVRFRGAGALSPRESIVDRTLSDEPWRQCSRPLRLAYVTAQGTALPCCIAPFTDAPYDSISLGNYLRDGVQKVWTGDAYRIFRERLYSSSPPTACQNCGLAWSL
jgi:MoaA/NifB/PqqE/SkfB family radical SAM enzyme